MLTLADIETQVKQDSLEPNTLNLAGLSITYRQLKALGWISTGDVHPINRTSTLTLDRATVYGLHNQNLNKTWVIELDGQTHQVTGSASDVTIRALELMDGSTREIPFRKNGILIGLLVI